MSAWIAILAMTLNALWPLLAQAKPAPESNLHELCTAAGIQIVAVGGELPAHQPNLSPHCAFCSLGTDRVAIAPMAQIGVVHGCGVRDAFPVFVSAPFPESHSHTSAQPRAPPFPS
jgi:hypothetical protein